MTSLTILYIYRKNTNNAKLLLILNPPARHICQPQRMNVASKLMTVAELKIG